MPPFADSSPRPDRTLTLRPNRRVTLVVDHFLPTHAPRGWAVLVHGFGMFAGVQWPLASALAAQGIAAVVFDCRGHGRSSGRRGHIQRFDDYVDDLAAVIEEAQEAFPGSPWVLMGHSHGATIALILALQAHRPRPTALLVSAPLLRLALPIPRWKRWLARPLATLWPTLSMHNALDARLATRDPEAVQLFLHEPLIHHVATPRWFCEMERATRWLATQPTRLAIPTLMMLAGDDLIIDNAAARAFASGAAGYAEVRTYPGVRHEMFWGSDGIDVVAGAVGWIASAVGVRTR